jgi:tetratricopeptide (TPR) repeat protein
MSEGIFDRVEALRQQAVGQFLANDLEQALETFDQALGLADDDEQRELLVINKASTLIALQQAGPEVQQLPQIIMRRRNLRHLYLAAYTLQGKFENERDFKRASLYARIALDAAEEAGEIGWKTQVLIALGNLSVFDSKNEEAIGRYREALELLEVTPANSLRRAAALQNLGYCELLEGDTRAGIDRIHTAIELFIEAGAEGFIPESHIDLCYGYLDLGELDQALHYGELGLARAKDLRQIRNAHFLLGEAAYKTGDLDRAEIHFEHLAKHYPDFPHLKNLLLAIDLRAMVNLKL